MASPAPEQFRPLRRVEYDKLVALGTFEGERIELIGGALRHMSPIGPPHSSTVDRLTRLLVSEYWVVNLIEHVVEVHREPAAGDYRQVTTVPKGARLQLLAFPDVELAIDDFVR